MPTHGIMYVAAGKKYIRAAVRSAGTVREHCPGLPIHLFADWQEYGFNFEIDPGPFTSVGPMENPHRRSKVDLLSQTPFDWTLYLDTDTAVRADIREMFRLMERFDIAATHAHHRNGPMMRAAMNAGLTTAFPPFNSGVLLFRKTPHVIRFLEQWRNEYHEHSAVYRQDQTTLRRLLWKTDLRIATLPPEYNVRYIKYHLLWSKHEAESQIFHLRFYHVGWYAWLFRPLAKFQTRVMRRLRKYGKGGLWRGRGDS